MAGYAHHWVSIVCLGCCPDLLSQARVFIRWTGKILRSILLNFVVVETINKYFYIMPFDREISVHIQYVLNCCRMEIEAYLRCCQ
jgi:hypothetical protein